MLQVQNEDGKKFFCNIVKQHNSFLERQSKFQLSKKKKKKSTMKLSILI